MFSIDWIIAGILCGVAGLFSWVVWSEDLWTFWQGTLALWFVWYSIQTLLRPIGIQKLQWFLRFGSTVAFLAGLLWQGGYWTVELSDPLRESVVQDDPLGWIWALSIFSVLLGLWLRYADNRQAGEKGLSWVRHSIVLVSVSVMVEALRYKEIDVSQYWSSTLLGWLLIVGSVDLFWTLWSVRSWQTTRQVHSPVLDIVSSRLNPVQSIFDALEGLFGIDIQGTWIIRFVRQMLEPLAVVLVLFGWLSTTMVQVHSNEQGVRSSFGQPEEMVLEGGLHWKLPYPFGRVDRVESRRIHQLSIGHEEIEELDTEQEGPESILWANQHGDEEFLLLLGDGHDVISADGVLEYRISNVHQYLFASQNPTEVLESVVYQVLMEQTSSRTLEAALSENLLGLAQLVTREIQNRIGQYQIGIEPLLFTFTALHPPVLVAKNYQDVVSAQIDQQTTVLRAEQYQLSSLPKVRSKAFREVEQAKQNRALSLATAYGEALSFEALRQTVRTQESLYRFRKRQENLQRSITGRPLVILDHRLESQGATLWINP